jgi:hypothetical protein
MEWSGGLNPSAVAGKLSVTRLTHNNCTGINASGMPSSTVKKMLVSKNGSQYHAYSTHRERKKSDIPDDLANIRRNYTSSHRSIRPITI